MKTLTNVMTIAILATAHLAYSGDKITKPNKSANNNTRLCLKSPSSARERAIFSPGKDGEAGDIGCIVDAAGCSQAGKGPLEARATFQTEPKVILTSEVEWTHLNPKRGDLAPKAGTLWGDRKGTGATGFLLKPTNGFESPPHIHNVSYRGVVINGVIHNDDPNAANMWMPTGSFWTQPKGEVHITAAKGASALAYIEIEEGPYLVLPKEEAFDSGERPVNVDKTNIVWLNAADITWIDQPKTQVAFLWGSTLEGELNGTFIKLPAGFSGTIKSRGSTFRAVVIKGLPQYRVVCETKTLEPGSYFSSEGEAVHQISSDAGKETIIYIRTDGNYEVNPAIDRR